MAPKPFSVTAEVGQRLRLSQGLAGDAGAKRGWDPQQYKRGVSGSQGCTEHWQADSIWLHMPQLHPDERNFDAKQLQHNLPLAMGALINFYWHCPSRLEAMGFRALTTALSAK